MKFYDELSKVYDVVFKKDEKTVDFLRSMLNPGYKVLDLACGTGTYAIELAKEGYNVTGMDLDSEMIKLANSKSEGLDIRFIKEDMRKIKVNFEVESLNLTFCIGNSLVHLQDKNEIKALIKDMYSTLKDKGTMVIQIINYDRIIRQNVKSLPTIDRSNEGVKFIRNYNHEEDESIIHFQAELIISKNGINETYKNSVPLVAIQSDELISMIREAGFKEIDVYGDFSKNEFSENSYALIVAAHK